MLTFWVRSSYSDSRMSLHRLELSKLTVIPSIAAQTIPVKVILKVSNADPHLKERLDAWGKVDMYPVFNWPEPVGICARVDDDDIISANYANEIELIDGGGEAGWDCLTMVTGSILIDGILRKMNHNKSMFLATRNQSPFAYKHGEPEKWGVVHRLTHETPQWVWVRHGQNKSPELKGYSAGKSIHIADHFPHIDFSKLIMLCKHLDSAGQDVFCRDVQDAK